MVDKWLNIGDTVLWVKTMTPAKVIGIDFTEPGKAYGRKVEKVLWDLVPTNVVVDLDNGKWAHGYQIAEMQNPQIEFSDSIEE